MDYDSLATSIRSCAACSFRHESIEPLSPEWVYVPVQIMFVGENPSWEKEQNMPFAPNTISGKALERHYLEPPGLSRVQVWITDLLKCRYPKTIYRRKTEFDHQLQHSASTCAHLWLLKEVEFAKPRILVTLSDKEVYQRLRWAFELDIPKDFKKAVGNPHPILPGGYKLILFPMIHPDISRPIGDGDNRKLKARLKWAIKHRDEHIPSLKQLKMVVTLHEQFMRGEISQGKMAEILGINRVDLIHLLEP